MKLLGESVEESRLNEILSASENFIEELLQHINKAKQLDQNYSEPNNIPDTDYYLIYNRFVKVGKRKIDKRIVRKINRRTIIEELDLNWFPGLEPNFILLPTNINLSFGIYIQDSIYLYKTDIYC